MPGGTYFADRFPVTGAFDPAPDYSWYNAQVDMLNGTTFEQRWAPVNELNATFDERFGGMDSSWSVHGAADGGRFDFLYHDYW